MTNKDNKEEIVPFTQKNEPEKKSKVGIYAICASVLLGVSVLGFGYYSTLSDKEPVKDKIEQTTKTTTSENSDNIVDGYNLKFKDMVNADEHKSLEDKVIDYTQEPFTDGYKIQNDNLTYLNGDEASKLIENGDKFLVYVGRPNCPYCHLFRQAQDKVLKELGVKIYSIDTIYARYDTKLFDIVDKTLGVETVPEVLVVENGEVKSTLFSDLGEDDGFKEDSIKQWFTNNLK